MQRASNIKATIQQIVLKRLHWTWDEYTTYQYERGIDYLAKYLEFDQEGQRILQGERYFWGWWLMRWLQRDAEFIISSDGQHELVCRELYHVIHDADELIVAMKPPKIVTKKAFL